MLNQYITPKDTTLTNHSATELIMSWLRFDENVDYKFKSSDLVIRQR